MVFLCINIATHYPSTSTSTNHRTTTQNTKYRASGYDSKEQRNTSLEALVPKRERQSTAREVKPRTMASNENGNGGSAAVNIERMKSYGIGGAGNIRRPSDVIYPPRANANGRSRRSSVWSTFTTSPGSSPDGRRASIMNLFRKNSVSDGKVEVAGEETAVQFNNPDLGGTKEN